MEGSELGERSMQLAAASAALFLVLAPAAAAAQSFAAFTQDGTFNNFGFGVDTTRGWEFSVTEPIQVEELGFWDSDLDGLNTAHPIGIWASDMTLLTSARSRREPRRRWRGPSAGSRRRP